MPGQDPPPITEYFTGLAGLYEQYRPRYAQRAIDTLLQRLPEPADVADVGCGTGIATRQLAAAGARTIGIEPNADMVEVARSVSNDAIEYRIATAEATGLPDGAVDLVASAQAFHWFDPDRALPEFHRILRLQGRLGMMWNERLEDSPASAAYADIVRQAQAAARVQSSWATRNRLRDPGGTGLFDNVRSQSFDNPQVLDRDGLLGRARSTSYFPREGPIRDRLEHELLELFDRFAQDGTVTIRQRTVLTLADRM